jgi:8-oxo-dGTP pyrophosphatase MutT (NUDIX family)
MMMKVDFYCLETKKNAPSRMGGSGGKIEGRETIEQCAIREPREELGIYIILGQKVGVYPTSSSEGTFRVHTYLARIILGNPEVQLDERGKHDNLGWYNVQEMRDFRSRGRLDPNLCVALDDLERYGFGTK